MKICTILSKKLVALTSIHSSLQLKQAARTKCYCTGSRIGPGEGAPKSPETYSKTRRKALSECRTTKA